MNPGQSSRRLTNALFTTAAMREVFSDAGRLQAMLDFEAALGAPPEVREHLDAAHLDRLFDPAQATGAAAQWISRVLAARGS